jgi:hypothetical protein
VTQSTISLEALQKTIIGFIAVIIILMSILGVIMFSHYEGYGCKTVETTKTTTQINAWCGHNGKLVTNSSGTFWHIEGWNF